MQTEGYIGIEKPCEAVLKAGGSRFLGFIHPVKDRREVDELLKSYRETYRDATHVCFAYILGQDREEQYASDAGEPSGSAGRPMLNALLSAGISQVLAVVVRYYGGKKLGIPGLIAAYGGVVEACLKDAPTVNRTLIGEIRCTIPQEKTYLLYNFLNARRIDHHLEEDTFVLSCPLKEQASLREELEQISGLSISS